MNQSHWLILVFVATMVCNGNSRPRELEVTNIYPVYRSIKQLELENRYEKPFDTKQDDDSVAYLRIDIPYQHVNSFKPTENSIIKNNSKSVIDYVPVALTIKKTNVKKWPSDQNGIESQDDLSLYNTYTSNINPVNVVQSSSGGSFTYIPNSRPSILILEELTNRPPYISDNRPVQDLSPPRPQEKPQFGFLTNRPIQGTTTAKPFINQYSTSYQYRPPTEKPVYAPAAIPINPVYRPPPRPVYAQSPPPTTPVYNPSPPHPVYAIPPYPADVPITQILTETTTLQYGYVSSTAQPETTTKKRKKTKCPNVSIVATSSINNNNSMNKEGCQDISIHIDTNLSNINTNVVKPTKPATSTAMVPVQSDPPTQTGGMGILEILWSLVTRIFSFSFSNPFYSAFLAPFSSLLAGGVSLSAMILPWFFPHMLLGRRKRYKKRFFKPGRRPAKYSYRPIEDDSHYLNRKTRDLTLFYGSRRKKKKGKAMHEHEFYAQPYAYALQF